jgi:hypothetical protein
VKGSLFFVGLTKVDKSASYNSSPPRSSSASFTSGCRGGTIASSWAYMPVQPVGFFRTCGIVLCIVSIEGGGERVVVRLVSCGVCQRMQTDSNRLREMGIAIREGKKNSRTTTEQNTYRLNDSL